MIRPCRTPVQAPRRFLTLLLLACCLALAAPVAAQDDEGQALRSLLEEFLDGASRGDAAMHERFWADDLIYTSSGGNRFGKSDILAGMEDSTPDPAGPQVRYWAEDTQLRLMGDTAVVAFRLMAEERATPDAAPESSQYLNTGTFIRREGEWRAVAWQATRVPEAE